MKTNIFKIILAATSIAILSFPAWGTDVGGIIDRCGGGVGLALAFGVGSDHGKWL